MVGVCLDKTKKIVQPNKQMNATFSKGNDNF